MSFPNFPLSLLRFLIIHYYFWPPNYVEKSGHHVTRESRSRSVKIIPRGRRNVNNSRQSPPPRIGCMLLKITTGDVIYLPCTGGCCLKPQAVVTGPISRAARVTMAHWWTSYILKVNMALRKQVNLAALKWCVIMCFLSCFHVIGELVSPLVVGITKFGSNLVS